MKNIKKRLLAGLSALAIAMTSGVPAVFAEGSRELAAAPAQTNNNNEDVAYRPYLEWRDREQLGDVDENGKVTNTVRSKNVLYTYAKAGETVYFGQSGRYASKKSITAVATKGTPTTAQMNAFENNYADLQGSTIAVTLPKSVKEAYDPSSLGASAVYKDGRTEFPAQGSVALDGDHNIYLFKPVDKKGVITNAKEEAAGPNYDGTNTYGYDPFSFVAPVTGTYSFRFLSLEYVKEETYTVSATEVPLGLDYPGDAAPAAESAAAPAELSDAVTFEEPAAEEMSVLEPEEPVAAAEPAAESSGGFEAVSDSTPAEEYAAADDMADEAADAGIGGAFPNIGVSRLSRPARSSILASSPALKYASGRFFDTVNVNENYTGVTISGAAEIVGVEPVFSSLPVAVMGVASLSEATTTTYDFEDGNTLFTNAKGFTFATVNDETLNSNVIAFTTTAGNDFAYYDFSELVSGATKTVIEFDYYNVAGARAIVSLSDTSARSNSTIDASVTGGTNEGAAFKIGAGDSSRSYVNSTQYTTLYSQWLHVKVTADEVNNIYSYSVTDSSGNVLSSGLNIAFSTLGGVGVNNITQIDVQARVTGNTSLKIDNLKIQTLDDYSVTFSESNGVTGADIIMDELGTSIPLRYENGTYYYKVRKSGYKDYRGSFTVNSEDTIAQYTLLGGTDREYDFEDLINPFTNIERTSMGLSYDATTESNVLSFSQSNSGALAKYDFSGLIGNNTKTTIIDVDCYIVKGGNTAVVSLGDVSSRSNDTGSQYYSSNGAAFAFGAHRTNIGGNGDYTRVAQSTTGIAFANSIYANKWLHIKVTVDRDNKTYSYIISELDGTELSSGTGISLDANATDAYEINDINEIDVFGGNSGTSLRLDNLAIKTINEYNITLNETNNVTATVTVNGESANLNIPMALNEGTYTFTATAAGYRTYNGVFTVAGGDQTVNFTMIPEDMYALNIDSNITGGTIAVSGGATAATENATITISTTPSSGYAVTGVSYTDSNNITTAATSNGDGTYSFTMPASDVTVTATFGLIYTITATQPSGATIAANVNTATAGTPITVTTTPDTGYVVSAVSYTDANDVTTAATNNGNGTFTFTMPASNVTITATVADNNSYTITTASATGGTAAVSSDSALVGTTITVTPSAEAAYTVSGVTVTDAGSSSVSVTDNGDGTYSFVMPASNVTVTPVFTAKPVYTVTLTSSVDQSVIGTADIYEGGSVTIPYPKYQLSGTTLYEAGKTNNEYRKTISDVAQPTAVPVTYTATDKTNVVYYSEGENISGATTSVMGNIPIRSSNAAAGYPASGETLSLTTLPAGKYKITAGIYTNNSGTHTLKFGLGGNNYDFIVEGASNLTNVEQSVTINEASPLTFTQGSQGEALDYIYVEEIPTYSIDTTNITGSGTVTASASSLIEAGTSITLTAAPAEGSELTSISAADASSNTVELTDNGNGTYTFIMPASNVNVTAAFAGAFSATVTAKTADGTVLQTYNGTSADGSSIRIFYNKYIYSNGSYYVIAANGSYPSYAVDFAQAGNVDKIYTLASDVAYASEMESFEPDDGKSWVAGGSYAERYSNGAARRMGKANNGSRVLTGYTAQTNSKATVTVWGRNQASSSNGSVSIYFRNSSGSFVDASGSTTDSSGNAYTAPVFIAALPIWASGNGMGERSVDVVIPAGCTLGIFNANTSTGETNTYNNNIEMDYVVVSNVVPAYDITIDSSITGGTVTSSAATAGAGDTVTITATPAEYHSLTSLTITDANSATVTATDNQDGTYTFTMPASNVTISATFGETAAMKTVTVNAVDTNGTVIQTLSTQSNYVGASVSYGIPMYLTDASYRVTYACTETSYYPSHTVSETDAENTISVVYEAYTGTAYFREGESLGSGAGYYTYSGRLSNGHAGRAFTKDYTVFTLPAGKYNVTYAALTNNAGDNKGGTVGLYLGSSSGEEISSVNVDHITTTNVLTSGTLTAPAECDEATNVVVRGTMTTGSLDYVFAEAIPTYSVTTTVTGGGGTIAAAPNSNIEPDEIVTLYITPETGYVRDTLTAVDGTGATVEITNNSFVMPASNVTVTATFREASPAGALTVNYMSGGVQIGSDSSYAAQTVTYGEGTSFTYYWPAYVLYNGSYYAAATNGVYGAAVTLTAAPMTVNVEYTLASDIIYYADVTPANGWSNASVTSAAANNMTYNKSDASMGDAYYNMGNGSRTWSQTVTIPSAGVYEFFGPVYIDSARRSRSYTVEIAGVDNAEQEFATTSAVTQWQNFSIVKYLEAGTYTFVYTAPRNNNPYIDYLAVRSKTAYTVTAQSDAYGTIVAPSQAGEGENVSFNITPTYGFAIETVTVSDGTNTYEAVSDGSGAYSFTMPAANVTISATYTESATHSIQTIITGSGTVDVEPSETDYENGTTVTVTPTAANEYNFTSMTYSYVEGGTMITNDLTLTDGSAIFTMPNASVEIRAIFTDSKLERRLTRIPLNNSVRNAAGEYSGYTVPDSNVLLNQYFGAYNGGMSVAANGTVTFTQVSDPVNKTGVLVFIPNTSGVITVTHTGGIKMAQTMYSSRIAQNTVAISDGTGTIKAVVEKGVPMYIYATEANAAVTSVSLWQVSEDYAGQEWRLENGSAPLVGAWDITVVDANGNEKKGRTWSDIFFMNVKMYQRGIYSKINILTDDAYEYKFGFNGTQPYGFLFYSNNRGFLMDKVGVDGTRSIQPLMHSFYSFSEDGMGRMPNKVEKSGFVTYVYGNYTPMREEDHNNRMFINDVDAAAGDTTTAMYAYTGQTQRQTAGDESIMNLIRPRFIGYGGNSDNKVYQDTSIRNVYGYNNGTGVYGEVNKATIGLGGKFVFTIKEGAASGASGNVVTLTPEALASIKGKNFTIQMDFSGYKLDANYAPVTRNARYKDPITEEISTVQEWEEIDTTPTNAEKNNIVTLSTIMIDGARTYNIIWDGRDAYGNEVPVTVIDDPGTETTQKFYPAKMYAESGMVHMPMVDVEAIPYGVRIKRLAPNDDTASLFEAGDASLSDSRTDNDAYNLYYNNYAVSPSFSDANGNATASGIDTNIADGVGVYNRIADTTWYYVGREKYPYPSQIGDGTNASAGVSTQNSGQMVVTQYDSKDTDNGKVYTEKARSIQTTEQAYGDRSGLDMWSSSKVLLDTMYVGVSPSTNTTWSGAIVSFVAEDGRTSVTDANNPLKVSHVTDVTANETVEYPAHVGRATQAEYDARTGETALVSFGNTVSTAFLSEFTAGPTERTTDGENTVDYPIQGVLWTVTVPNDDPENDNDNVYVKVDETGTASYATGWDQFKTNGTRIMGDSTEVSYPDGSGSRTTFTEGTNMVIKNKGAIYQTDGTGFKLMFKHKLPTITSYTSTPTTLAGGVTATDEGISVAPQQTFKVVIGIVLDNIYAPKAEAIATYVDNKSETDGGSTVAGTYDKFDGYQELYFGASGDGVSAFSSTVGSGAAGFYNHEKNIYQGGQVSLSQMEAMLFSRDFAVSFGDEPDETVESVGDINSEQSEISGESDEIEMEDLSDGIETIDDILGAFDD